MLILENYSPELIFIQGSKNVSVDLLRRLDILGTPNPIENNIKSVNEHYWSKDIYILHPTHYKTITKNQQKDKELIKIAQNNKKYSLQNFHGAK